MQCAHNGSNFEQNPVQSDSWNRYKETLSFPFNLNSLDLCSMTQLYRQGLFQLVAHFVPYASYSNMFRLIYVAIFRECTQRGMFSYKYIYISLPMIKTKCAF